jgi:hypothetical protein
MADVIDFQPGGFKFIKGPFQYSAGVAALPGHRIERVRFANPLPLQEGFSRISEFLQSRDRPLTAFCACELRSPGQFTDEGFVAFNRSYAAVLEQWGLFALGDNPVARSNVCPEIDPPAEPSFHAFSYAMRESGTPPSFVSAGSGESMEGNATYAERTVALGDTSPAGMLLKAQHVLGVMEARMAALGFTWADTTGVQVYTVFDIFPFLATEIVKRGAGRHGATWQFARPPVVGLDYEMDCRGVHRESVI